MLYADKFTPSVGKLCRPVIYVAYFFFSWALLLQIFVCKYLAQLR